MKDVKPTQVGLDGGLNLKVDPTRLDPPATTRADNVWHIAPGNVAQLPGLVAQNVGTPLHVYNLATRDPTVLAYEGDVLAHGEYPDIYTPGMTRSTWAAHKGTIPSFLQSIPHAIRLTSFGSVAAQTNANSYFDPQAPLTYGSGVLLAREENGTFKGRFFAAMFRGGTSTSTSGSSVIGYLGNTSSLSEITSLTSGSSVYIGDSIGNLNRSDLTLVTQGSSSTINVSFYSFQASGTGSTSLTGSQPQCFNHAGRTYIGFAGPSTGFVPSIYDVVAGTTATLASQGSSAPATTAFASPYALQSSTSTTYCAMVFGRSLYVLARTSVGAWSIAAGGVGLPAANTVPSGTMNYQATCAVNIVDTQGGVGTGAQLMVTVFGHFPEAASATQIGGSSGNIAFQSVYAATYKFIASGNTLTKVGSTNVFRTPSGAGLVSKAFTANPSELNYAGPSAAKQAFVVVQSGALEINPDTIYQSTSIYDTSSVRGGQPTYFVINHAGQVVARIGEEAACYYNAKFAAYGAYGSQGTPDGFSPCYNLSNPLFVAATPDDNALLHIAIPVMQNAPFVTARLSGTFVLQDRAPSSVTTQPAFITLSLPASGLPTASCGSCMFTTGALPQLHDGNTSVEQNYHFAANNAIIKFTTAISSSTGDQFYNFAVVYNWRDEQGRTHRSAPSTPTTVKVPSGYTFNSLNAYVAAPATLRASVSGPILAQLYASLPNATDTRMYYIGQVSTPGLDVTSVVTPAWYYNIALNYDASSLASRPALYNTYSATSVATYDAQSPRAGFHMVAGKGRLYTLAQVVGQQRVYYSSVATDVLPFEWNFLNYAAVPPEVGDARGLEMLDDKLIVLGTRTNAAMTGDGPTPQASTNRPTPNDGFSPLTPIPTPAGVIGTGAPARIPEGIAYQGYGGIQILGRDLANGAMGAQVDALTGRWVGTQGVVLGRAVTLPSLQSVVWPNPAGPALVYSYLTKKWSTWPLLAGASALVQRMDGTVYYALQPVSGQQLSAACEVGILQAGAWSPVAAATSTGPGLVVETPWVPVAGSTGGEADLTDMMLVGTWLGPHTLQVEQAYNYGPYSLTQTADMSVQPAAYQTRWRPLQTSRVWSVRYRITLAPLTTLAAGYAMASLSDLLLYCMPKPGTTHTPERRTR